jgi:hypothetical protein
MRMTEAQLRSAIRKMLLEFTPALKADAEWADLTDGSGPMKGLMSGKTIPQAIKDLYGHLLELEPGELEDQYPELNASIIASGDEDAALDHLRVVVTAVHAENEKDYDRDAVRQDLMYFATKSKRPELKVLQQRVLDPKEPEYTITSLAYEQDLKAVLGKIEDEVASLSDEEAKRIRNVLSAEEAEDRFARPRPQADFKTDPDAETVPGVKEEGKKRKSQKMPPGYKAKKGTARGKRLRQLTKQYQDAKKTPGKADDMAAIKARDAYEKTQKKSNRKSKYTEGEVMSEDVLRQLIQEIALDEKKKRKKRKKKRKSRKISSKVNAALKNKAKKHNAPLGALKAVYRKGMGAFYTSGSRPGQNPHSWSMGRVNSFLKGGKARQVDATQWKQVQKHRARKRKK